MASVKNLETTALNIKLNEKQERKSCLKKETRNLKKMKSNNAISETLVRSASNINSQRSLGKEKGSCLSFSTSKVSD